MSKPGPIIVHNLDHARAALKAAAERGVTVTLLSPPGAAGYMGPAMFKEMMETAALERPQAEFRAILDCGEEAGSAMKALRAGVIRLRLRASGDTLRRIAEMGAELTACDGPALDLDPQADPLAAARQWLLGKNDRV